MRAGRYRQPWMSGPDAGRSATYDSGSAYRRPAGGGVPDVSGLAASVVSELKTIVAPDYVHERPSEIIAYSFDGTFQQRRPDLAVSPASTEEVAAVMRIAARERIPIIARGASS